MSRKIRFFLTLIPLVLFCVTIILPPSVQAQIGTSTWSGVCTNNGKEDGVATIQGLQCLLANVLSVVITIIGLAGFVMVIVGSFRFLLSGGNAKGVEQGSQTITFAVIGLVVALSSYFILNIVSSFTGVKDILLFSLCLPGQTCN